MIEFGPKVRIGQLCHGRGLEAPRVGGHLGVIKFDQVHGKNLHFLIDDNLVIGDIMCRSFAGFSAQVHSDVVALVTAAKRKPKIALLLIPLLHHREGIT